MISDKELMRGDYVMFFSKHKIGHIAIVDQVLRHSCLLLYKGNPDSDEYETEVVVNYENIEPIKLTAGILEKSGFEKCDKNLFYFDNGNFSLVYDYDYTEEKLCRGKLWMLETNFNDGDEESLGGMLIKKVRYVHELQSFLQNIYLPSDVRDELKIQF